MEEIKNKLSEGYDLIQKLNLKPTKGNMEILLYVMAAMQDAYQFINEHCKPEEPKKELVADVVPANECVKEEEPET